MNHDELLAKISRTHHSDGYVAPIQNLRLALRAVVELHKPRTIQLTPDFEYTNCVCGNDYPCPTIQVIEKELG
jgi:hypothetical protein